MHFPHRSTSGRRRVMRGLAVVLAPLTLCLAAASASAAGPAVIVKVHPASGIVSPYFKLAASPARSVTAGSLQLVNPTSRRLMVRLDPVDAITTSTLGSAYAPANAGIHGSTAWLRLSRTTVSVSPHGSQSVAVSVHVPSTAASGDYLSGVSVEALGQSQTATVKGGLAIGQIDRYAIGVEVTLPGPRHAVLKVTGAKVEREPAGLAFLVSVSNPGNVILDNVHGSVRVTSGNRLVAATVIAPGTFVSGTSISYPLRALRENPAEGTRYRVQVMLGYPGGVARLQTPVVFGHLAAVTQQSYGGRKLPEPSSPWRWIIGLVVILVVVSALGAGLRRRARPLAAAAGMRLLERSLARLGDGGRDPVSTALVASDSRSARRITAALRPRLRRTDRICDLGDDGLLVIRPATSRRAVAALCDDFSEHLARHPELAGRSVQVSHATATTPTTAAELIDEAKADQRPRHGLAGVSGGESAVPRRG